MAGCSALGPLGEQAARGAALGAGGGCGAAGFRARARAAAASAGAATRAGAGAGAGAAAAPAMVAVLGLGTRAWAEAAAGLALAGGLCPALLPWRWGPVELRRALVALRPAALLVDRTCLPLLRRAFPCGEGEGEKAGGLLGGLERRLGAAVPSLGAGSLLPLEDLVPGRAGGALPGAPPASVDADVGAVGDPCCICYTSGSGGVPRAVPLSHAAFAAQARAKAGVMGFSGADVHLHLAPPFHVGGLCALFTALHSGGRHILLPRYSPGAAVAAARRHGATALAVVPAVLDDVHLEALGSRSERGGALDSVSTVLVGGAGPTPAQLRRAREVFPNASIYTAYGMTEACSSITLAALHLAPGAPARAREFKVDGRDVWGTRGGACVGRSLPHCEVAVVVPAGGAAAGPPAYGEDVGTLALAADGEVGEVAVRGPAVMCGYLGGGGRFWQGWFLTGDAGFLDNRGRLFLSGRLKDVIRSGGETVYPAEVERVLAGAPGVRSAAVAAVPHPRLGEAVGALLVLSEGWVWQSPGGRGAVAPGDGPPGGGGVLSANLVKEHCCSAGLAPYKAPRVVAVVAPGGSLPQTPLGKVDRKGVAAVLLRVQEDTSRGRTRL